MDETGLSRKRRQPGRPRRPSDRNRPAAGGGPAVRVEPELLDRVPGAIAAFGLRRLRVGHGDRPILRLRHRDDGPGRGAVDVAGAEIDWSAVLAAAAEPECTMWCDQSPNGNDAVAIGAGPAVSWAADRGTPVLRLAPPVQLRSPLTLEGMAEFTILAVFRVASREHATSVARWQRDGNLVVFPYHTGEVLVGVHNTPADAVPLAIAAGRFDVHGAVWRHNAARGLATYRNGALVARRATRTAAITVGGEPLFIGSYGGTVEHFRGDLAELVIWPRALSEDELQVAAADMSAGSAGAISTATAPPPREPNLGERMSRVLGLDEPALRRLGMDRVTADMRAILADPAFAELPVDRQTQMVARISELHTGHWHASGRSLIAPLELLFHRLLATPGIGVDALCVLYDLLYFLYWCGAAELDMMRGIGDGVMRPFAAAIRHRAISGLPPPRRRRLGDSPMRLCCLSQFARRGNPASAGTEALLGGLSRQLPDAYRLLLYAWSEYDAATLDALNDDGIDVRVFGAASDGGRLAAIADAIAADGIDIIVTDMNTALPTVLFERRSAPVQVFFQQGVPFWPLDSVDAVLRVDNYEPQLAGFDPGRSAILGLGAWDIDALAPWVDPATVVAERRRFPQGRLVGCYGRLAKITDEYLEIAAELIAGHEDLVVVIGGTGDGGPIRRFIAERGLAGRLELVEEHVNGHVWGHMLDFFLDTSPQEGGRAAREVMAKGRPVVTIAGPWSDAERIPMLVAEEAAGCRAIASRLLDDRAFYAAACAATVEFVASRPREAEVIGVVHAMLQAAVRRARAGRRSCEGVGASA